MSRFRIGIVAAIAGAGLLGVAPIGVVARAQTPRDRPVVPAAPPATAPALIGKGSIAGHVVADADGRPLSGAVVIAIGAASGALKIASTDASGTFVFNGLVDDRYTIGASRAPFLGAVAGARRAARPGVPAVVAAGAALTGVDVRLPMGGVIAGRITAPDGQPLAGASVGAFQWKARPGGKSLVRATGTAGGTVTADDKGRYRIYGLSPGEYLVAATALGSSFSTVHALTEAEVNAALAGTPLPPPTDPDARPALTYFPGTLRVEEGVPVVLAAGDERNGLDLQVQVARPRAISGIVEAFDGSPVPSTIIIALSVGSPSASAMTAQVPPGTGAFRLPRFQPGVYRLQVSASINGVRMSAAQTVEVGTSDVTDARLVLRPPVVMNARAVFDGATPPAFAGRRLNLISASKFEGESVGVVSPLDATGAFTLTQPTAGSLLVSGQLNFGATDDSVKWALQSVVVDGKDLTDLPVDINLDAPPKSFVVTFTDKWQQLSGRIAKSTGEPVTNLTVLVLSKDPAYWYSNSRRVVSARPDSDGRFTLGGRGFVSLPPGEYVLLAVDDLGRDEQYDPSFLATVVAAGTPLTIAPNEKKTQDLVIR